MSYYQDWQNGVRNRNYFVLQELLKRPEVSQIIAVDYLPISFKQKIKVIITQFNNCELPARKASLAKAGGRIANYIKQISDKLFLCSILNLKTLNNFLNKHIKNSQFAIRNSTILIWSYFPLYINYFDEIDADLRVFDAVDDWSKHPSYKNQSQLLIDNYRQIAKKADVIFTVSDYLRQSLFKGQKNVYWIPNGTNVKCQSPNIKSMSKSKCQNRKIIVGYIGTIQSRVDFELVRYLAEHHLDKEFMFVGPVWKDAEVEKVRELKNVKFVGQIPYDDLPKCLSKFDIGIIPHKINDFTQSMDPMKFYEYLAFGLPVVSTQKLTDNRQLLYFADNPADFSEAIKLALKENSQDLIDRRQKFAQKNSWERRVEEMMKIISNF